MELAGLRMVLLYRANGMPSWRFRSDSKLGIGHRIILPAYYSATAKYVCWVNQLSNPALWAVGQNMTRHDSWTAPNLIALRDTHERLLLDYQPPGEIGDEAAPAPGNAAEAPLPWPLFPFRPLTALLQCRNRRKKKVTRTPGQRRGVSLCAS